MFIKPVPGRLVRDPHTKRPVPPEGMEVSDTDPFWARRLADGDVAQDRAPAAPAAPPVKLVKE